MEMKPYEGERFYTNNENPDEFYYDPSKKEKCTDYDKQRFAEAIKSGTAIHAFRGSLCNWWLIRKNVPIR